jgi:hypothetical protein
MKKAGVIFSVVLALLSGSLSLASASTIKPGTTCSKSGAVTTQNSIKYICVSQNKKLTWKVLATAPSHTHVTPPVTTPSISPTPSSTTASTPADLVLNTVDYVPAPPAGGSDDYRCFLIDPKFTSETFLKAVTITPNNLDVSHHGILYKVEAANTAATKLIDSQSKEPGWSCFGDTGIPGATAFSPAAPSSWISFWAPGGDFKEYPANTGMKIKSGDQFILQSHFHLRNGTAQSASMKVALSLAPANSKTSELKTLLIAAPIELPCTSAEKGPLCARDAALADLAKRTSAKAAMQESALLYICGKDPRNPIASNTSDCTSTLPSTTTIYGATGHMHQLGRTINITYINKATGKSTVLSSREIWDFDNQKTDWQAKPIQAEQGDQIKVTCTYDVSLRSKLPEFRDLSPNYVVWGEGTRDEMCLAIINYTN